MPELLLRPSHYYHTALWAVKVLGIPTVAGAVLGLALNRRLWPLTIAYGVAYAGYCLIFTHNTESHDYYHIVLMPMVAIGLASLTEKLAASLSGRGYLLKVAGAAALILGMALTWGITYRLNPDYVVWSDSAINLEQSRDQALGEQLIPGTKVAYFGPNYGKPLMYYSRLIVDAWPTKSDKEHKALIGTAWPSDPEILKQFISDGCRYFVIAFPADKWEGTYDLLNGNYELVKSDEGLLVYDLARPLRPDLPAAQP